MSSTHAAPFLAPPRPTHASFSPLELILRRGILLERVLRGVDESKMLLQKSCKASRTMAGGALGSFCGGRLISQVLGHNEHLYVKLPKGFWSAHVIMGAGVTMEAVLLLLAPSIASSLGVTPHLDEDATPAARVAGAALAGLCVFVWSLLGTSDKHYARTMLLSMITYHVLAVCVAGAAAFTEDDVDAVDEYRLAMVVALRAAMCLLCLAYFYSIAGYTPIRGQKPSGFPQSSCSRKEN
nr:uncharacterized protein LOC113800266 [Penaeus vannamei]